MHHYLGYFAFKPKRAKMGVQFSASDYKAKEAKKAYKKSRVFILFGLKGEERVGVIGVFTCNLSAERRRNRVEIIKYNTGKDEFPYYFDDFVIQEYGVKE